MVWAIIASVLAFVTVILAFIEIMKKNIDYKIKSCSIRLCITSLATICQLVSVCIALYNKEWVGSVIVLMGYILYMTIQAVNFKLLIDAKLEK